MKQSLFLLIVLITSCAMQGQMKADSISKLNLQNIHISEPAFIEEVIYVNDSIGNGINLEKKESENKEKPKKKNGEYFTARFIQKNSSPIRINHNSTLFFLLPYEDQINPYEYIKVFKLTKEKLFRSVEDAKFKTHLIGESELSFIEDDYIKFTYNKYGLKSYLIAIDKLEPGEYAITVNTKKTGTYYCFGID